MAATNIYSIYACRIDGTTFPVTQQSVDPGLVTQIVGVNGEVNPTMAFIASARNVISFGTPALKAVFDKLATPWQSYGIVDGSESPAIFYLRRNVPYGGRSEASDFISFTSINGLLVPRPLTIQHPQAGVMQFDYFPISSDGEALPITVTATAADPTLSLLAGNMWTTGDIKINAVSIESTKYTGVQSITFDPGITLTQITGSGEVYDTFIGVNEARPTVRVQFADGKTLAELGIGGVAQGANDSTIFLRKIDPDATRIAKATAEHISLAINAGVITPGPTSGTHGQAVTSELLITPVVASGTVQVVVNTATAIS